MQDKAFGEGRTCRCRTMGPETRRLLVRHRIRTFVAIRPDARDIHTLGERAAGSRCAPPADRPFSWIFRRGVVRGLWGPAWRPIHLRPKHGDQTRRFRLPQRVETMVSQERLDGVDARPCIPITDGPRCNRDSVRPPPSGPVGANVDTAASARREAREVGW